MARKRMIDPSIWTDEGMTELTPRQQLLYIALFSNADDKGRLRGSPKALRMMLPTLFAKVKDEAITLDLDAVLREMRQLTRYEVEDRQYLVFENYLKWQRIDRPTSSSLPLNGGISEPSTNTQRALDPSLVEVSLGEEKLGEVGAQKNAGAPAPEPPPPRKKRETKTYEPVDDGFLEAMRVKYEPVFGSDAYALKVRKCLGWADQKRYKDRRTYLEEWLEGDALKLRSGTNGSGYGNAGGGGASRAGPDLDLYRAREDANRKRALAWEAEREDANRKRALAWEAERAAAGSATAREAGADGEPGLDREPPEPACAPVDRVGRGSEARGSASAGVPAAARSP